MISATEGKAKMMLWLMLPDIKVKNIYRWDGTPGCKHWEAFMTSLFKCDFHGALIKVISSKCCSYLMVAGVIILESKNTFQIVGADNKLKS